MTHDCAALTLLMAIARISFSVAAAPRYGVAAECALKQIMRESGIRPLPPEQRRDDPYYAHFPTLKTMLCDNIHGRRQGELRGYAEDDNLMSEWDTDMRYAPGREITERRVDRWREHASRLVHAMEGT